MTAGTSWVTEYSADRIDTYGPEFRRPGACSGDNYMRFHRGLAEGSFRDNYYWNGWSSPVPVAAGDTLKVEYAVYIDSLDGTAISGDGTAFAHASFSNAADGWIARRIAWTSLTFPMATSGRRPAVQACPRATCSAAITTARGRR